MDTLLQDIRLSLRDLVARPGFTAVAVLTLAIAIGANTAMFSIVNATLLRRLPFAQPERLTAIHLVLPKNMAAERGETEMVWSYPKYETFRAAQHAFADTAVYEESEVSLTGREQPERLTGEAVGAAYFRTLGVVPQLGRGFLPEEDSQPGTRTLVVLGHSLWTRQFAADPRVVGSLVKLDGKAYTIVGVAPPGFKGLTGTAEYWIPVMARPADYLAEAFSHEFDLVGRLAPGITPEQAASQVAALGRLIDEAHVHPIEANRGWGATARPLEAERIDPSIQRGVLVLFAAVGLVLLIACANLANLQLARAESRRGEVAVRMAVGASRGRLVRQLLTESLVLALAGAVAGVLLAWLCVRALSAIDPGGEMTFGRPLTGLSSLVLSSIRIDGTALAFTLLAATATAVLFGLAPALRATRVEVCDALRGVEEAERGRRILQTLRVPLLRGRDFASADRMGEPKVVLVNETAAWRFWPGEDPIGKRVGVYQGGFDVGAEVVGIVGDMRFTTAEEPPQPDVFISYGQARRRSALVYLRTEGKPEALVGEVRRAVAALDRSLPIYDVKTMSERTAAATARSRYSAILLATFAAIALILAAVGVYGVTSYDVTQRTREIGIRMALGAERRTVLAMILRQGIAMTLAGTAFGLAGAYAATRGLRALLYGVAPTDPATFIAVTAVMAAVATAACLVPAGRAMRINPLVAIRRQ